MFKNQNNYNCLSRSKPSYLDSSNNLLSTSNLEENSIHDKINFKQHGSITNKDNIKNYSNISQNYFEKVTKSKPIKLNLFNQVILLK